MKYILVIFIGLQLSGCEPKIDEITKFTNILHKDYYDGHKVRIEQYVTVTKYRYSILGNNRVDTINHTYGVYWSPGNIIWNEVMIRGRDGTRYYNGDMVPKMMVVCHGKLLLEYHIDSGYVYEDGQFTDGIVREFVEHVDERYLFKYFGSQYWVAINKHDFNKKTTNCKRYKLPTNF